MRTLVAALACAALAGPAFAGQPVMLKANIVDADGVITLGDLFDGAGAAARTPVANRAGATMMLNAAMVQAIARRSGLDWSNAEGYSRIVVSAKAPSAPAPAPTPTRVVAERANVDVLTWARHIAAGEVIQPQDMIWGKAALAPSDAPSDPDAMVGQAARRALRAGAPVASRDVAAQQVIKAGETINLVFQDGGLMLQLQAKALSGGALGETINVQNTSSKKIVQAIVSGPGQAAVGPGADRLKLTNPTRYALR